MHFEKKDRWAFLGSSDFYEDYVNPTDGLLRFYVEGVRCSRCLSTIEGYAKEPGVSALRFDMSQNVLTLSTSKPKLLPDLLEKLEAEGFKLHLVDPKDSAECFDQKENHRQLIRLGLSGACAGNIMLLAVAQYAGLSGPLNEIFCWISFALALPVVTYASYPFYRNIYTRLRHGRSSIDLPIGLAIIVGFLLSTYHLVHNSGDIYFDSLSVLVFLILASRYFLFRLQRRFLSTRHLSPFISMRKARCWRDGQWREVPLASLKAKNRILVKQGELIPSDGRLVSEGAAIDTAILTGESLPRKILKNMDCFAGTRLISNHAEIEVTDVGHSSRLGKILQSIEEQFQGKTALTSLTDRVAGWFTFSIVTAAAVFLLVYVSIDAEEAIRRTLALVILACPCALAFATPLTQSLSLVKAAKQGWLVRQADSLEKMAKVKRVAFDKTGTLTKGELNLLSSDSSQLTWLDKRIIVTLEKVSHHPLAFALQKEFSSAPPLEGLREHKEVLGQGVQALFHGQLYQVKKLEGEPSDEERIELRCGYFVNGKLKASFVFGDRLREEAHQVVADLQKKGLKISLLSGDNAGAVRNISNDLNIKDFYFNLSPEEKLKLLIQQEDSMMVGDGSNDAAALAASSVGVAVQGSMEASLKAADIYLAEADLWSIPGLISLSRRNLLTIKRNLIFSVFYNLTFGSLALLGFINPLAAAVLMPASSLTVLILSLWGTKTLNFKLQSPPARAGSRQVLQEAL